MCELAVHINRSWDLGVNEAYVQLNEVFYTPATLKIGRQYLNYGHGLILSSAEQEYNFDAGRLVLDYYPLTIDLVGAEVVNNASRLPPATSLLGTGGSADCCSSTRRYELTDSIIKNVEAYFGWVAQGSGGNLYLHREFRRPIRSTHLVHRRGLLACAATCSLSTIWRFGSRVLMKVVRTVLRSAKASARSC